MQDSDYAAIDGLTDAQRALIESMVPFHVAFAFALAAGAKTYGAAYKKAGGTGKTQASINEKSFKLSRTPKVDALYRMLLKYPLKESLLQREEAIDMLTQMSKVKVSDVCTFKPIYIGDDEFGLPVYQDGWVIKDLSKLPDHIQQAVKSISHTKFGTKVDLVSSEECMKQVRAMQGWDSAAKHDITSAGQSLTPTVVERRIVDPQADE